MSYFTGVLSLLDDLIGAMLGVSVFSVFLCGYVLYAAFGVAMMLKNAAKGGRVR